MKRRTQHSERRTQETGVRRQEIRDGRGRTGLRIAAILASGFWLLTSPPQAAFCFEGGTGTRGDPYRIATAEQLLSIGSDPNLLDKHFVLAADIDLSPIKLAGHKVLRQAPIAPALTGHGDVSGPPFGGVFDGRGHRISNLTITAGSYLGLFGRLGAGARVMDLALVDINITKAGSCAGGLAGYSEGSVIRCYSTGGVSGTQKVGGLVGWNLGTVIQSYSTVAITANNEAAGLVGTNEGSVIWCYAQGPVTDEGVAFTSKDRAGGLVASNRGHIACCYSTGEVRGAGQYAGGLVGENTGCISGCLWDTQTSGRPGSAGDRGLTTVEMQDVQTYLDAGWDWVGESANGTSEIWQIPSRGGYPVLAILSGYAPRSLRGQGTPDDPYRVADALDLGAMVYHGPDAHYRLAASIDLAGPRWSTAVVPCFSGVFDGNGLEISHLAIAGGASLGLFGDLAASAEVRDLSLVDVNVTASGDAVGGLAGISGAVVTQCSSTGTIAGAGRDVGGLVGINRGRISYCHTQGLVLCTGSMRMSSGFGGLAGGNSGHLTTSYSTADVQGSDSAGGLVGIHGGSTLSQCFSTGRVSGGHAGGLVAFNSALITDCYSRSTVSGVQIGGLVANNGGPIVRCYSTGLVSPTAGPTDVGGLAGSNGGRGLVTQCFWDFQVSGQTSSIVGTGKTTALMQDIRTYLAAGWDFVGETANGAHEIWKMPAEGGYPVLSILDGYTPPALEGQGTPEAPYLIATAADLGAMIHCSPTAHYRLAASIDLAGTHWGSAVIPEFAGTFDGNGLTISNLTINGRDNLGLFGKASGTIRHVTLVDVNVTGTGDSIGGLAGASAAAVERCTATGTVSGDTRVGGLIGASTGSVFECGYAGSVLGGRFYVGGLVGDNRGPAVSCSSSGEVKAASRVGGLVGTNAGDLACCYSTAAVTAESDVAGLAGTNSGTVHQCYSAGRVSAGTWNYGGLVVGNTRLTVTASFWDTQTSGQTRSDGGTGLATSQMQSAATFTAAGWDLVNLWTICEAKAYPRLRWEGRQCAN